MKILSAIGRFFARIGRWIKETAWIQPLLIVGGIFAIIFAIPHVINGVKGWFSESDSVNKFYAQYQLSLKGADKGDNGESEVDKLFTYIYEGNESGVKKIAGGDRFFLVFVQKNNSSAKDLYSGIKMFKDKWSDKNAEFEGLDGKFTLKVVYTDTTNDDEENLFDMAWNTHYELFEELANEYYLPNTYYARNKGYKVEKYAQNFLSDSTLEKCPMNTPLMMYFDYTDSNPIAAEDQRVKGLSDVVFSVEGSSDLDKARTLRDCWAHKDVFGEIKQNND